MRIRFDPCVWGQDPEGPKRPHASRCRIIHVSRATYAFHALTTIVPTCALRDPTGVSTRRVAPPPVRQEDRPPTRLTSRRAAQGDGPVLLVARLAQPTSPMPKHQGQSANMARERRRTRSKQRSRRARPMSPSARLVSTTKCRRCVQRRLDVATKASDRSFDADAPPPTGGPLRGTQRLRAASKQTSCSGVRQKTPRQSPQ